MNMLSWKLFNSLKVCSQVAKVVFLTQLRHLLCTFSRPFSSSIYPLAAKLFVVSTDPSLECKLGLLGYKWPARSGSRHLPRSLATSLELARLGFVYPPKCVNILVTQGRNSCVSGAWTAKLCNGNRCHRDR